MFALVDRAAACPFLTSLTELEIKRRRPWLCDRDARRVAWRLLWRGEWRDEDGLARCERGGRRSGDRRFRDAWQLRDDDELRVRGVRLLWCGVRRLASTFVLLELRRLNLPWDWQKAHCAFAC